MEKYFKLNNNVKIPSIGFGTWQTPEGETAINSIKIAVQTGYRHIDAAAIYGNEKSIGVSIKECGLERKELFVTSKVWNTERGYETTLKAFEKTLKDLQLDYLDLYLIHWPASAHQFNNWREINADTWKAMEKLYTEGKIRALGLSNFMEHHLEALLDNANIKPSVNQIEYHPGCMQDACVNYCNENNILVEGWSPLGRGKVLEHKMLKEIAFKYNKSVAQVCIRWALQNKVLPLPKSTTPHRIKENFDVFDFEISASNMKAINQLDNFGSSGLHPDTIDF
ncbi:oxidoreductase [Sediminicola sp. YIK13]|uniref:aldo/keto reductase n=1 Tax=Sediminicola sp. YIK13 TaxID=1453352 RepID=UPI00072047F8|nr:aldo/keto reductase [Sediminicola sp. YIK13]ALM09232.1 oxidoreductase [Sediminicola sp. YIK13]